MPSNDCFSDFSSLRGKIPPYLNEGGKLFKLLKDFLDAHVSIDGISARELLCDRNRARRISPI